MDAHYVTKMLDEVFPNSFSGCAFERIRLSRDPAAVLVHWLALPKCQDIEVFFFSSTVSILSVPYRLVA